MSPDERRAMKMLGLGRTRDVPGIERRRVLEIQRGWVEPTPSEQKAIRAVLPS